MSWGFLLDGRPDLTSQAIHPSIVDYYLAQMPGVVPSHAKKRLFLLAPYDGSPRPLSAKLLERPKLLVMSSSPRLWISNSSPASRTRWS